MKHLGDITKISGHEAPTVDCVIGGSPCQGLSNAGKRLGLNDERSGLYIEQIRIVKEMREHDRIRRGADEPVSPRYMVWENVPGAFSTGDPKGADFQAVLEEAIRIAEPEAPSIPIPPKGWNTSGCIVDGLGRWSLAWRVTDAQYWGVPQRRRRICMVVDFNGVTAPQIVFGDAEFQRSTASAGGNKAVGHLGAECGREVSAVEDGLRGHLEESEPQREEAAGDVGASSSATVCLEGNGSRPSHHGDGYIESDTMYTLNATEHHAVAFCKSASPKFADDATVWKPCKVTNTLNTFDLGETRANELVVEQPAASYWDGGQLCGTLTANNANGGQRMPDKENFNCVITAAGADIRNATETPESVGPLQAAMNHNLNSNGVIRTGYIVRRLTPREAESLQGFPEGWTDIGDWADSKGKKHKASDSPRYKALGNSISIPNWKYIIKRLCAHYERDATMASLFDGIGGFPYIWEQLNGKGSCIWASEIEEFPMAVTKMRFGE